MAMFHQLGVLIRMGTMVLVHTSNLMVVVPCAEAHNLTLGLHRMVKVIGSSVNNFGLNVGMRGAFSLHFLNFYYRTSVFL